MKKEAKTLAEPTGKLNTTNLSINNLIREQRERTGNISVDLPKNPFDKDDLIRMWKTIAHGYKVNGEDPLYQIMIKRDLQQVTATTYFFEVDTSLQKEKLDRAMMDILMKLREDLQNYELEITSDISKSAETDVRHASGKERFERMAKKNPNLSLFQNRFNLDIDY